MLPEEETAEPNILTSEEGNYPVVYNVTFNNCTFNEKVVINQTGEPPDPPDDPPGGNP